MRATGSGAGCGNHWPTCNGVIIPQPRQIETAIEFIHRLLSGGALLLVLAMLVWGWKISQKGDQVRKGLVASAVFIIAESLLGASLVLFGLVTTNQSLARAVMMAFHLLNTFFLLASITMTAWWASGGNAVSVKDNGRNTWLLAIGLGGVALIGMTGAITALGDTLFPAASLAHGLAQDSDPNAHFLIRLRVYHPAIAIIVGAYSILLVRYFRSKNDNSGSRSLGNALIVIVLVQWAAGLANVILLAPVPMQIIHLFIADAIWIILVLFSAVNLEPKNNVRLSTIPVEVM